MKEKRISLRFREDNDRDMRAWRLLEEMANTKNVSKNTVAIELILLGAENNDSTSEDTLAELIAERVAAKISGKLLMHSGNSEAEGGANRLSDVSTRDEAEASADEPVYLGEDALDFLDAFG